jgi:hypothetical protein
MTDELPRKSWRLLLVVVSAIVILVVVFSFPPGRNLLGKFIGSLRMQKVQTVNVNLSAFVGPNANRTLQDMVTQMISDKVTVTQNEKTQTAPDAAAASKLAGFSVELPSKRKDAPELAVGGQHAFDLVVDRARLQAILREAGRPDLNLPESIDGTTISVKIPRIVRARYGDCPGMPSATADVATPTPNTTEYSNCVILSEGPSPVVNVPSGVDFEQLAQIGLELAGMTPDQSQQFLQTVNWKSTLGMSIPRFMRSYEEVQVNGVKGTLLNMAGRRGPAYTLIWARNGIAYSLTGYGDPGDAVPLANSLQ